MCVCVCVCVCVCLCIKRKLNEKSDGDSRVDLDLLSLALFEFFQTYMVFMLLAICRPRDSTTSPCLGSVQDAIVTEIIIKCTFLWKFNEKSDDNIHSLVNLLF